MRLVVLESPLNGDAATPEERARVVPRNRRYLLRCIRDCLARGESPMASHQMLVDVCDDTQPEERDLGIRAGFAWRTAARATVIYTDHGISSGMRYGIEDAVRERDARLYAPSQGPHAIEYRTIGAEPEEVSA